MALRQVGPQEIAAEKHLVFPQVGEHGFRPVHPGREYEFQGLAPQVQLLAVAHGLESVPGKQQQVHEHGLALLVGHHHGLGIDLQDRAQGTGMVLLGMLADDVVDAGHPGFLQIFEQFPGFAGIDRVDQRHLVAAPDQVGIVGGAFGQGDQFIEKAPVPIQGAHACDVFCDFNRRHVSSR